LGSRELEHGLSAGGGSAIVKLSSDFDVNKYKTPSEGWLLLETFKGMILGMSVYEMQAKKGGTRTARLSWMFCAAERAGIEKMKPACTPPSAHLPL
jgi:hypothetical protein